MGRWGTASMSDTTDVSGYSNQVLRSAKEPNSDIFRTKTKTTQNFFLNIQKMLFVHIFFMFLYFCVFLVAKKLEICFVDLKFNFSLFPRWSHNFSSLVYLWDQLTVGETGDINYSPPKSRMGWVTFHYSSLPEKTWKSKNIRLQKLCNTKKICA